MMPTRRQLLCTMLPTIATTFSEQGGCQRRPLPFCKYSIRTGWSASTVSEYIARRATTEDQSGVPQVVAEIRETLDIDTDFDVLIAEHEDNAFATIAGGRKILVVDVGFLDRLNRMTGTAWAAIQVIAHEVGHHVAGFGMDSHQNELNADYWSGQTLQRLGASASATTRAIMRVGTDNDTPSHPNRFRRRSSMLAGWHDAAAGRIDFSKCLGCR